MDSEIVFGQVEHLPPERAVRPDRNRLFSVVACGEVDPEDLPMFVDLDVMRDMEAHARTNTHVELGGVLLGGQYVDSDGEPFVVVREALRAEHYEATRGSFKFTHDTWEQITRDREQFPKDLQLVGWYHTHPDWGVFLSGMDMFICEHFFGKELDVALVIDPCRGDRGWFYWQMDGGQRQKTKSASFYLMTNRYRQGELTQFASKLNHPDPAFYDPRYNLSIGESAVQPVVNIHDQRSVGQSIALIGMLTVQLLVVALIAYRVLMPPAASTAEEQAAQAGNDQVYQAILNHLVNSNPEGENIVDYFRAVEQKNRILTSSIKGQVALTDKLESQYQELLKQRDALDTNLTENRKLLTESSEEIAGLKKEVKQQKKLLDAAGGETSFWNRSIAWPMAAILALLTAAFGAFAAHLFSRRQVLEDDYDDQGDKPFSPDFEPSPQESPLVKMDDETDPDH